MKSYFVVICKISSVNYYRPKSMFRFRILSNQFKNRTILPTASYLKTSLYQQSA